MNAENVKVVEIAAGFLRHNHSKSRSFFCAFQAQETKLSEQTLKPISCFCWKKKNAVLHVTFIADIAILSLLRVFVLYWIDLIRYRKGFVYFFAHYISQ